MNKVIYETKNGPRVEVGQFYRFEGDGVSELYLITIVTTHSRSMYNLVCIADGMPWEEPVEDVNDVFGKFQSRFKLVIGTFTITTDGN